MIKSRGFVEKKFDIISIFNKKKFFLSRIFFTYKILTFLNQKNLKIYSGVSFQR